MRSFSTCFPWPGGSLSRSLVGRFGLSAVLVSLLAAPTDAAAQTSKPTINCKDASRPNIAYVAGSTALRPFLVVLARILATEAQPTSIVYQAQGSCTGVAAIFDESPAKRQMRDIPNNWATLLNPDGSAQECWLDKGGAGENPSNPDWPDVDVGISDVFASSCQDGSGRPYAAPSGVTIGDYFGPVQPMVFVVPAASSQRSISAEAAALLFGRGGSSGQALPWIDPSLYFVRNANSGTQQMIARAIGVPANKWWGKDRGSATGVVGQLKLIVDGTTADKAIGIASTDFADAERNNIRVLAFKASGQSCGYYPDRSLTSRDKLNVRDGHYPVWGPSHLFARTAGGVPSGPAGALLSRFAVARIDQDLLDAIIDRGLVPQCAMRVTRSDELGPMASFAPAFDCSCYFESKTTGGSSCKACAGPADCGGDRPSCNLGFCEAR